MAEFHFLRPLWFVLLPVGAWLIWQLLRGRADEGGWRRVVDAQLYRHVLVEPEVLRDSRLALIAALVAWLIAIAALAGPTWERLPVPAFRSDEALVVALDLSRSMDAADVEPSRLARAKLKLLDLLERRAAGQTALVVFSTHAFTVTPLTTDTRTIASLVNAVNTDIMPTPGGSIAAGLDRAATLLRQTGLSRGDILLITDSEVSDDELDLARELAGDGLLVSVLAVGTEQGAPIPQAEGGFVNDDSGSVVVPQVDSGRLQRLASRGGGRFARLTPNDRDLETLFPSTTSLPLDVALAKAGELEDAIGAYDRALELVPDHADARYNRDLVEQFLKDNPEAQQPPPNQGQGEQGQQGDSDQSQAQSGDQQDGEQSGDEQQGEQGEPGDTQGGDGSQDPQNDEAQGDPQSEGETEQNANAGEEATDASESSPAPQDVEQWASEQAAEQWLRRVPQDPGGLLRRKFLYQYQRLGVDQSGNSVQNGAAAEQKRW